MELDKKGRCCGRKPDYYRGLGRHSPIRPYYFCPNCKREYNMDGAQQENWFWKKDTISIYRRRAIKAFE